jgi:RimJ/RimL family protein N-acetyltransferase
LGRLGRLLEIRAAEYLESIIPVWNNTVIGAFHVTLQPTPEQQLSPSSGIPYWFNEAYPGKGTVGYWLDEAHRWRGIVDEAFQALSRYMARCHNVHRMLSFRVGTD